ncbi:MAG: alpha/beta hydrolase [Rhodobacter sp.]|nr:alpha/beta hydrolase [Rhodobacter sp.]
MPIPKAPRFVLASGIVTLSISAFSVLAQSPARPDISPVLDRSGRVLAEGLVSLERVSLGGVEQTILIRGGGPDLPILLFLHGGPGGAVIPWVDLFHTPLLEENFIVVHWDQRGSGSSFSTDLTVEDITPEKMVADTLELTDLLRARFGQDKIFLTGQSWGSALGFMTIAKDSSPYLAYIPTSERVDWDRSMNMGYAWALDQARANGHADVLAGLEAIAPFDAFDEADLQVQRQALDLYRGGDYHTVGLWDQYLGYALDGKSPYYTMAEIQNYIPGLELSSLAIEQADLLETYDLFASHPSVDIPVHFVTGAEDRNTPAELAFEYYEFLEAPAKSFTRIDDAAHMVLYDQPDAWAEALVEIKNATLAQ